MKIELHKIKISDTLENNQSNFLFAVDYKQKTTKIV